MNVRTVRRRRSPLVVAAASVVLTTATLAGAQVIVGLAGVTYDTTGGSFNETQSLLHDPGLGSTPDGGLTKLGPNNLSLTGPTLTYTGTTTITEGRLIIGGATLSGSKLITIASGGGLELSSGTYLSGKTVTGTGSIIKSGPFTNGFQEANTSIQLAAGSLIDVQQGYFYGADPRTVNGTTPSQGAFANFSGSINIAAGAIFDGGIADIPMARLTGAGIYQGGSFGTRAMTVGLTDASSQFDGTLRGNNFGSGTISFTKLGNGTFTSTGAITVTTFTVRGGTSASPSAVTLSPTGVVTVTASGSSFQIGSASSNDYASVTITSGTVNVPRVGLGESQGTGILNLTGGTLNIGGNLVTSGNTNGRGYVNISGGNLNLNNNGGMFFGNFNGGSGTFTSVVQTGGTVSFYSDAGTTLGGTGRINVRTSNQYYHLNGGTLRVGQFGFSGQASNSPFGAFGNLYLNGGTLVTTINTTDYFGETTKTSTNSNAVWNVYLGLAGGTVDTLANTVVFNRSLQRDPAVTTTGTFTKAGTGTLTFGGGFSYNGPTAVTAGQLILPVGSGNMASKSLSIAQNAALELSLTANSTQSPALTVTGSGSLIKSGNFELLLTSVGHSISLGAAGLIDIRAGSFKAADFNSADSGGDNNGLFANNSASLRIAAGATFAGEMANVRIGALTGAGNYTAGWFFTRGLVLGLGDASGVFTGSMGPNGTTTLGPSITKTGTGTQSLTGQTTLYNVTVNRGTLDLAPTGPATLNVGSTPFAGPGVSVAPNSTDVGTLLIGPGVTINASSFGIANSGNAGIGVVNQAGGTVNANTLGLAQGGTNASATYNLSGGTLNVGTGGVDTSTNNLAVTTLNISAGELRLLANSTFRLGNFNNRPTTIVQTGGTVAFFDAGTNAGGTGGFLLQGSSASAPAAYRLNGGSLSVPRFGFGGQAASLPFGAVGNLYLNGGTLITPVSTADFFGESTRTAPESNAVWNLYLGAVGGIVDTTGSDVTFNVPVARDPGLGTSTADGGLTKIGTGTLRLSATSTYTGPTTVTGGTLIAQRPLRPVTGSLVVTGPGATVALAATGTTATVAGEFSSISVSSSGQAALAANDRTVNGASVLVVGSVSLASGGTLNLANGDLIVRAGDPAAVASLLASGSIYSSLAGTVTSDARDAVARLGVLSNTDAFGLPRFATFDGVSVAANDVLVKYTYAGDTDLNGTLDARDFNAVLNGFSNGLSGWENGDVNYDGVVDGTDFGLFLNAYTVVGGGGAAFSEDGPGGGGTIPEPALLGLFAPVVATLTRRRRTTHR